MGNSESTQETEMSLYDIWEFLKKNIIWIMIAVLIGAVGGFVYSNYFITKEYSSSSYIYTPSSSKDVSINLEDLNLGKSLMDDYIQIMKSKTVINAAIKSADDFAAEDGKTMSHSFTYSEVLSALTITNPSNTHILVITVTTAYPYDSSYLSNALSYEAAQLLPLIMDTKSISRYQNASPVLKPVSPNNLRNAVIGGIILAILVTGILFLRTLLDSTLKSEDDVMKRLGLNTLATVSDGAQLRKIKKLKGRTKQHI